MATVLAGLKGRFILSLNDVPRGRQTFATFQITSVKTTYSILAVTTGADRAEVSIPNFPLGE